MALAGSLFAVVLGFVVLTTDDGDTLHWSQPSVPFAMNNAGTPDVAGTGEFAAIEASFQHWDDVCSINYTSQGQTALDINSIYNGAGVEVTDGNSIVVWQNSNWIYGGGTIGITFTWFNGDTGVIAEADMLLNGQDYFWTTGAPDTDVESIVTHEAGHYLGLGHSGQSEATMFATVGPGETKKRSLHQDDIDGALCIYDGDCVGSPIDEEPRSCSCHISEKPRARVAGLASLVVLAVGGVIARKRRVAKALLVCLAASFGFASTANATVMRDMSIAELAAESDSVVIGTVERVETWTDGSTIQTSTYVVVHEVLGGTDHGTVVEVRTPGGELPKGVSGPNGFTGMRASGLPRFAAGDEVVLFLATRAGALRVSGLAQGKFLVSRDAVSGRVRLYRDLSEVLRISAGEPVTEDALDGIPLEELRKALP